MSQQIINLGTADKGNGDVLRTAFTKVNENFAELYNSVSAVVVASATAPAGPGAGDLWWNSEDGRMYIYYGTAWVDASPVDGAGINSTNELVNGNKTVSLDPNGLTTFPTFQTGTESLYLQGTEFGSVNSGVAIAAKNQIILAANVLGNQKNWNFGTEGKLTLPAGTTYEYLNAPLTGHGDGLARLDFTLVTDGVDTQWAAASASPAGSGYSPGDTFTFDAEFLGIPGASVTIEVLTVGAGGSVENLAFTQPPLYPADIYRDSPINLQVGPESNRWTFGHTGKLTTPGDIQLGANSYLRFSDSSFQGTAFVGDATRLYGNLDQDVDVIARPTPATVTATTTAGTDPFTGQFEISLGLDAVQAGWEMNTGTEQSPIWTTVTNASLNPGEYWIYLASGFEFQFSLSTAYTFRNPALLPKTWTFDTNGLLTFPNGSLTIGHGMGDTIASVDALVITGEGGIILSSVPDGATLSQINLGDQGNINIRSLTASGEKYWYFNSDGTLTGPGGKLSLPPNGKITSGVGAQIGYQAVIATDLYGNTTTGEVGGSTVVNVGSNAQLLALIDPASEFGGSQYNLLSPITITYSDNTTQTFSSVRSTNIVTGSVIVFGSNSDTTAGHNFPITLETANYAPAYTAPEWTFGIDGALTLPIGVSIDSSVSALYPKIIADSGKLFSVQGQGANGSAALSWTVDPDAASQYAAVAVSKGGGDNLAKVVLQAQSYSDDVATAKIWKFDETGVLTLPLDTVINETASSPGLLKKKYSGTFVLDPTWFAANAGNLIETTTINSTIQSTDLEVFDAFSFEFTGYFVPPTSANYTFKAHADETFIFWIGDKALSGYTYANKDMYGDYNGTFPEQQTQSFTIALTAGEFYPIRIQWANSAGWGQLDVFTWANNAGQADTADFTGRIYTANTGTAKIAVNNNRSIILSTDNATDNNWTFAPNGLLTFPDGTTTTGKSITVLVDQSLTVNTSYSMGPGGATTFKISPEHIKLPTGNGVIFSGTETAANSWGLDSANKTLYFPDAGDGVNPQIYYSKVDGVTGMELMTYAKSIKITAAQTNSWTFGTNGRTTFPAAAVPEHSYGVTGDSAGMVAFDATYIYYCTADYVNNTTDIWKRVAFDATPW